MKQQTRGQQLSGWRCISVNHSWRFLANLQDSITVFQLFEIFLWHHRYRFNQVQHPDNFLTYLARKRVQKFLNGCIPRRCCIKNNFSHKRYVNNLQAKNPFCTDIAILPSLLVRFLPIYPEPYNNTISTSFHLSGQYSVTSLR